MASILSTVGSILTAAVGWVSTCVNAITASGNELLLLACVLPFVGYGVHMLKMLLSAKA